MVRGCASRHLDEDLVVGMDGFGEDVVLRSCEVLKLRNLKNVRVGEALYTEKAGF